MAKFTKGQSGNPGGRPKFPSDIRALAKQYTAEAIETLAGIMTDAKASPTARVAAAAAILDRGWGKPNQSISAEVTSREPLLELSFEERRKFLIEKMGVQETPLDWDESDKAGG